MLEGSRETVNKALKLFPQGISGYFALCVTQSCPGKIQLMEMLFYEHPVRFGPPHCWHLDSSGSFSWAWGGAERSGGHFVLPQDHVCRPSSAYRSLQTTGEALTLVYQILNTQPGTSLTLRQYWLRYPPKHNLSPPGFSLLLYKPCMH